MTRDRGLLSRAMQRVEGRLGITAPASSASGHLRTRRMLATGSASSVVQIVALVATFVITPLLVRHLGATQYGVYATISSTVGWLGLLQLGLGPSVLNELSSRRTLEAPERGAVTVSSATAVQFVITGMLLLAILAAASLFSWVDLFNAPASISTVVSAAAVIMLVTLALQLPLSLGRTVFEAHQRGYIAQAWQLGTHLARLVAVVAAVAVGGSLATIVVALTAPGLIAQLGQYVHAFRYAYPALRPRTALVSWREGRSLVGVAADFFILSIASQVIASTDNLVIAHAIDPAQVTPYAVTSRLTQLPTVLVLLALQAAWPAYREAATHDVPWLRRTHGRMRLFGAALPVVAGGLLLLVGRPLIELWAGPEAVPSASLLGWLVLIAVIQGVLLPPGRLLTTLGSTRLNATVGAANAAINLPLSIVLAHRFGVPGVAMGTAAGYALTGWVLVVVSRRRLADLEDGWNA